MNTHARPDEFDSLMADWFDRDAEVRPPEQLLAATLERTARTRPLPAWRLPERWLPLATIAIRRPAVPRGAYVLVVIALLVLAFAAALVLYVGSHKRPPLIGPAANGRIAYVAGGQLFSADSDGTNVLQLTTGQALINAPAFSNDGTKLVYISSNMTSSKEAFLYGDLNVADADGTHVRVLLTNARAVSNPAWSPDGKFIAISSAAEGAVDHLNIVAVDGSGVTDFGDFDGAGAWSPSWSQDGQRLAVIVGENEFSQHIWILNRDGTNRRQISQGSYKQIGEDGGAAMWSPDGTQLLFGGGDQAAYYGQYIVGLDGAKEVSIDPKLGGNDGVWSPDGTRFAYLRPGTGSGPSVVIADRTGREVRVLDGQYAWRMPIWSPDGTRIAIADDRPGKFNLFGNPVTVILDAVGTAAPVTIPGVVGIDRGEIPSFSATWQRLAP
jgi:dipeptidyl aminopeptidase/acylaminoacyl peptidase